MDKELISEAGKYLKDVSSQGFQTYVEGLWATSILWASVGGFLLLLSVICLFISIKFYKLEYIANEENEEYIWTSLSISFMVVFFISGFIMVAFNLSGIVAPDYVAINKLIQNIKGE